MVWSEYVDHTRGDNDYSDDDENDDFIPPRRLSVDDWTTWYSEDLLNMWFSLVQYREDSGRKHDIMKNATYTDFCEFCYRFSHGFGA
jgi:hypothetical protein